MSNESIPVPGPIDRAAIAAAEKLIRPYIRRTPVIDIDPRDIGLTGERLLLKLEMMQHTGSFKTRGAFANLLMRPVPSTGVVAASGGNHGVAVAYAAHRLGMPATIFVPSVASKPKLELIRALGAHLVVAGDRYADALEASKAFVTDRGGMPVHAFDQRETLLGQGTVGLELEADAPDIGTLLVAVGGGGLIGGIAAWFGPRVKVIGVEPELAPTLSRALAAGHPVDAEAGGVAADSLAPRRVGEQMFLIAQRSVERVILVTDDEIRQAQQALWSICRIVAEPGGAAAFAALLSRRYEPSPTERVAILVCGANTSAVDFAASW